MEFKNLITDEEHSALKELCVIIPIVKAKYFSLGRDMDKLAKLFTVFGSTKEKK